MGQATHFLVIGDYILIDLLSYLSELPLGDHVHVLEAELSAGSGTPLMRVVMDTEQGVTVDEIAALTRRLRADLQLPGLLGVSSYRVEVTSPGVAGGLTQPWQFTRHVGRKLTILVVATDGDAPAVEVRGKLTQANPAGITLELPQETMMLNWEQIQRATVMLAW